MMTVVVVVVNYLPVYHTGTSNQQNVDNYLEKFNYFFSLVN